MDDTSQIFTITDLMGGECLIGTPDSIPNNCLQLCQNMEYGGDILQLQGVPGVVKKYSSWYAGGDIYSNHDDIAGNTNIIAYSPSDEITRGHYDTTHNCELIATKSALYKVDNSYNRTLLGTLTGTFEPIFCQYDNLVLIATGGQIQSFDGTTLATMTGTPLTHHVSVCFGRVRAYNILSDVINYSAIGDPVGWTNVPADISSSQFIQIGYKDAGYITSTMMLSTDLIVLKSSGTPYRVIGEDNFATIRIVAAAEKVYAWNYYCGLSVGNKCFFVGKEGFESFSTVTNYGAVKLDEPSPGQYVNTRIALDSDEGARLWHVPNKKQIWLKAHNDKVVYIYHYQLLANGVTGSWTRRSFTHQINDVYTKGKESHIFYGGMMGILDETTDLDDGVPIIQKLITKRKNPTLKKYVMDYLKYKSYNLLPGNAVLDVSTKQYPHILTTGDTPIFGDNSPIFGDNTPIFGERYTTISKHLQKRCNYLEAKLIVNRGRIAIREFSVRAEEIEY